jgi:hypothetical protein
VHKPAEASELAWKTIQRLMTGAKEGKPAGPENHGPREMGVEGHRDPRQSPTPQGEEGNEGAEDNMEVPQRNDDVIENPGAESQRSVGGVANTELRKRTGLTTLTARTTRTPRLAEEETVTMTEMEAAVMVMARAMKNKKTVMEDDAAGTAAATGAMRIPSKPKRTGTTPGVDQPPRRRDVIHLRKQQCQV